jgi:hypothetical protein
LYVYFFCSFLDSSPCRFTLQSLQPRTWTPWTNDVVTRLNLLYVFWHYPCHVVLLWLVLTGGIDILFKLLTTVWSGIGYLILKDVVKALTSSEWYILRSSSTRIMW